MICHANEGFCTALSRKATTTTDIRSPRTPSLSLFCHMADKHGTCAMSTPGFEVQNKYFANTLNLMEKLPVLV